MKIIFFLFCMLSIKTMGQKNAGPQYYDPHFKMPADPPVRLDGFYLLKTIYYDTVPMSNVKKNGYMNVEREFGTVYHFYNNGYFFYTNISSEISNVADKFLHDSSWVRKLYKMKGTDAWGFYTIRNDSVIIEMFQFEDNLNDIMKTFSKKYFTRSEIKYKPRDKQLTTEVKVAKGEGKMRSVNLPSEFISSPYAVDPANNKLFTDGRFKRQTGFNPD